MLLAEEETVLQGMIHRLIEIGRCCGTQLQAEITKVIRMSGQPSQLQIMIDQKQLENFEYFSCLGNMINDATCTREIKSRIAMEKAALNRKKNLITSKLELNLIKKLVKCYIWSTVLYGAERRELRKVDQKHLEKF